MKTLLRFPNLFSAFRSLAAFRNDAFDMSAGPTTYWDGRLRFERRTLDSLFGRSSAPADRTSDRTSDRNG